MLAGDGGAGAEALRRGSFDLVVLDVMMPVLDGLEVCKRLRARSTVPIIMLTAKSDEVDTVVGLELGADDYITKPFSMLLTPYDPDFHAAIQAFATVCRQYRNTLKKLVE